MRYLLPAFICCVALIARGADLPQRYAAQGELIFTQLPSAPFPHPKRADGHRYKGQLFSAKEHYSDSSVAIFIPKGFRETGKVDFIVHFHGWGSHVEAVLDHYRLIEQLVASNRNAVLVVPQGPRDAPDSFGGKLEDPDGFKRFMADVADTLRHKSALKKKDFAVGQIVLSGHSGGFEVIAAILDHGGLTEQIREVWLFDALYAQTPRFLAWIDRKQGRFIDIYTEHGGTKKETEQLMATLKKRGTAFLSGKESETKNSALRSNRLVFLYSDLPHDEVVFKRQQFCNYLKTSCFTSMARAAKATAADKPVPPGLALPPIYVPPRPKDAVQLPDAAAGETLKIELSQAAPGAVVVRRGQCGDGRLYLEIYSPAGPFQGKCHIEQGGRPVADRVLAGSLWLCRQPRIGTIALEVIEPLAGGANRTTKLSAPTTLVEIRGRRLFLNGEPLLVKGTLPGDLNDEDAAYVKSLGVNTLRTAKIELLDRYNFLGVVPLHGWPMHFCEKAATDEEFKQILERRFAERVDDYRAAMANPHLLILQLANEQVMGVGRAEGRTGRRPFDRLDYMLARCYNAYKPVDPMVPLGYANCAFGYRTPSFLDIYLHNTYLGKDRGWPPLEEFARFEGCDDRPFLHTEFGANVYMPQVYSQGPNTPVMEKIHAWDFPQRWTEFMRAGLVGGVNYRLFDGRPNPDKERQFTNFGIMTADHKPKLACWELWHLWRDFDVGQIIDNGEPAAYVNYPRDYWARDCRLTIEDGTTKRTLPLPDFRPRSGRAFHVGRLPASFRWRIDYTTHGGLTMVACGAYPLRREADEFLARLAGRPTLPFLRELFDAEVIAADGRRDMTTLKDMERPDGIVTVCFRKPGGRPVYVTAFARRATTPYVEGVQLDLAFNGRVTAVDEMTGKPLDTPVEVEHVGPSLRLKNVRVPYLNSRYSQRLNTPVRMPVYRIDGPA